MSKNGKNKKCQLKTKTPKVGRCVKFITPRTDGQYSYVEAIGDHPITLAIGPAGSGKTILAVSMAVKGLITGKYEKIVLTRPAVEAAGENLGFLPGDLTDKINPYMVPLYDSLQKVVGKQEMDRLLRDTVVEIVPLAYMRGRTLDRSFIIMDEAQNSTPAQVKMLMTRLGVDSKLVVTGDLHQSDISNPLEKNKNRHRSGLEDAVLRFSDDDSVVVARLRLCDIQRHPLIAHIIRAYDVRLDESTTVEDLYRGSNNT